MDDAIFLDKVGFNFGAETILSDVSLAVRTGEFICLLGPSGSGKSTLLRLMGGLLHASAGSIAVHGLPPQAARNKVSFVFQSARLVPWRTALGNVVLGMQLRFSISTREAEKQARAALSMVGLSEHLHKYPAALSGGQRQRVAIARAWAVQPDIVLMDEPFSALDPGIRQHLRDESLSIWEETGKTVVFVTHDVDEALYLADRIVLLAGKPAGIVETISLSEPQPLRQLDSPRLQDIRLRIHRHFNEQSSAFQLQEAA